MSRVVIPQCLRCLQWRMTGRPAGKAETGHPLRVREASGSSPGLVSTAKLRYAAQPGICPRHGSPAFAADPESPHRVGRPSNFSMLRRSRLVGRPVPWSRAATATVSSRGGGGGLLSM